MANIGNDEYERLNCKNSLLPARRRGRVDNYFIAEPASCHEWQGDSDVEKRGLLKHVSHENPCHVELGNRGISPLPPVVSHSFLRSSI